MYDVGKDKGWVVVWLQIKGIQFRINLVLLLLAMCCLYYAGRPPINGRGHVYNPNTLSHEMKVKLR